MINSLIAIILALGLAFTSVPVTYVDAPEEEIILTMEYPGAPDADKLILVLNNGFPVENVCVNVCTDTLCTQGYTDENGFLPIYGDEAVYSVHILSAPEGVVFDPQEEYILDGQFIVIYLGEKLWELPVY